MKLIFALLFGAAFGVCLQRSQIVRYDRQMGLLLLQDMTVLKFVLSAAGTAMIGIHLLVMAGLANFQFTPLLLGGNILGGVLFGLGWALCGYCPASAAGAAGEGRLDSVFALLGMVAGAWAFAHIYPFLERTVLFKGNMGLVDLPLLTGASPWAIIAVVLCVFALVMAWFEHKGL